MRKWAMRYFGSSGIGLSYRYPPRSVRMAADDRESIPITREVVAETEKPVVLYSIGKDSAAMSHLARKAFFPALPLFPLMRARGGAADPQTEPPGLIAGDPKTSPEESAEIIVGYWKGKGMLEP
jgi:hypothetical protein